MTGAEMIATERARQLGEEGWTAELDDGHTARELGYAATAYLREYCFRTGIENGKPGAIPPMEWPWADDDWKPTEDPIKQLAKAGALIAAEIDRLQRREERA